MADLEKTSVSVVLPAHNEENNIADVVRGVRLNLGREAEIVVVDDGSEDRTVAMAACAGADRLVCLPRKSGKGAALRKGFESARGEHVVFMDADGQDRPEDIPALLKPLKRGYDMVIGSRFMGTFHPGSISRINLWATRGFNWLIRLLFGFPVTDSQAGFRALRAGSFRAMEWTAREYEVETELLLKAIRRKARIAEVGVNRHPRRSGSSGFKRVRHGCRILWCILRERFLA